MERKPHKTDRDKRSQSSVNSSSRDQAPKRSKKLSEYGRQLEEKQKVKNIYGLREKQFRRFFAIASRSQDAAGATLLSLLERRLDNVLYRLKMTVSRPQARQIIVHGHVLVNNKKVYSPSFLVKPEDIVSFAVQVEQKPVFVEQVIDKRVNTASKVPEWLELDKKAHKGRILRMPVRTDIQSPIEEYLIVELYSK